MLWDGKKDDGTPAADGDYFVVVSFADEFTNAEAATPVAVEVDTVAPAVGSVTVLNRRFTPGVSRPLLTATITEPNLTGWTLTLRNSAGQVARTFTDSTGAVAVDFDGTNGAGTPLADGAYVLELVARDAAGNATTVAVPGNILVLAVEPTIDALTASEAFVSPAPASPTVQDRVTFSTAVRQVAAPTLTWVVDITRQGSPGLVRRFTQTVAVNPATKTVPISVNWDGSGVGVTDGVYTATATFTDSFGLTGGPVSASVTIDTALPAAGGVTSTATYIAPGTSGKVPTFTDLSGTVADANLRDWTFTVKNAGGAVIRTFTGPGTAATGQWDGRDQSGAVVPDGTYTVDLTARDLAGNTATGPATTVVVLTQPPAVTLVSAPPTTVYGQTFTLTATVTVPAGVTDLLAGVPVTFTGAGRTLGTANLAVQNGQGVASITVGPLDAGTYSDLVATTGGTDVFLSGTSAAAAHTVTPAPLAVRADNAGKVYGAGLPLPLTFQVAGLVAGDTADEVLDGDLTTTATAGSPVGAYPITRGALAANGNYTLAFTPGVLTVTPAPLLVRANDAVRVVGTANPTLTASYVGLVNGDTPEVVSGLALSTPAAIDSRVGFYPIVAGGNPTAPNYVVTTQNGTLRVVPAPTEVLVGSGRGTPAGAKVFNPDGTTKGPVADPFPGFAGGVRVALGDFNRDGVSDYVVGTGPGTAARFFVLDGTSQTELFADTPFGDFTGGLFVAAGDIDGDGAADLVVTPDEGGGPRVLIYHGGDFAQTRSYFGINDPAFRGGARAAVGDMNNDGFAEVAVSAGFGGGPRISVWDGRTLADPGATPRTLFGDFFAFETSLRNGTYAAIGDVTGDGFGDLIVGAGPGGGPRVLVLDSNTLRTRGGRPRWRPRWPTSSPGTSPTGAGSGWPPSSSTATCSPTW